MFHTFMDLHTISLSHSTGYLFLSLNLVSPCLLPGERVEQVGLLVNPALPWLGASPDGLVFEDATGDPPSCLIEIKSCRSLLGKKSPAWHQAVLRKKGC